ncbi:hypothetical protein ES702_03768 [subsurface metagenome]
MTISFGDNVRVISTPDTIGKKLSGLLYDALGYVRQGDTLVVWGLDRLGRSLKHLIEVINDLHERKVGFKILGISAQTRRNNSTTSKCCDIFKFQTIMAFGYHTVIQITK